MTLHLVDAARFARLVKLANAVVRYVEHGKTASPYADINTPTGIVRVAPEAP